MDFKDLVRDPATVVRQVKEWAELPHDKAGEELAKAQRKKLAKARAAHVKEHEKYLAKQAAQGVDAMKV